MPASEAADGGAAARGVVAGQPPETSARAAASRAVPGEGLTQALSALGLASHLSHSHDRHPDFVIDVGGTLVAVEAKGIVRPRDALELAARAESLGLPVLVAADRIAEPAKAILREAGIGYHDHRGRLRLVVPGTFIDAEVPSSTREPPPPAPLAGETAKETALLLLADPAARRGVREIARAIGRAPSSVSVALEVLRSAGLVTSANEPLVPDLFWELAGDWHRDPVPLVREPVPGDENVADRLGLGLGTSGTGMEAGRVLDPVGWALTDTLGAAAWCAPIAVGSAYPPDFYVPSTLEHRRAIQILGRAGSPDERGCTVSLPPARYVCSARVSRPGSTWPAASHVVVALDLAQDRARGRDVLERWQPGEVVRVW